MYTVMKKIFLDKNNQEKVTSTAKLKSSLCNKQADLLLKPHPSLPP